jgi:small-conductance mechanosensitive channel
MPQTIIQHAGPALAILTGSFSFAPPWAVSLIVLFGGTGVAWLLHAAIIATLRRVSAGRRPYLNSILDQTRRPIRLALLLIVVAIALSAAPVGAQTREFVGRLLGLATILLIGWAALISLRISADLYLMRFQMDAPDNLLARKHVTQVRVLVRMFDVVIVLVTIGFALLTFDAVREFGVTLFASAGVAGIVAGLAARPVLTNFLAGIQLAVAQPIRLDDAVVVENEWGNIEEITFTYVVVRLWDLRRMVVPLSYFIEKPFQNWTRTGGELIGTVLLYVDYTVPVEAVRTKLNEIVSQSKLWNGKVVNLQVTSCNERTVEVRALVSADDSSTTWDLRCEVREKLIDFLQREYPHALPRQRNEIVTVPSRRAEQAPAQTPAPPAQHGG